MAVYTQINETELQQFLSLYALGSLTEFQGIAAGIDNSNYFVKTSTGTYVLTLYEATPRSDLTAVFKLLNFLNETGLPCPTPQKSLGHATIETLKSKPAAIFNFLPGASLTQTAAIDCEKMGHCLARLHLNCKNHVFNKTNPKDLKGCQCLFNACKDLISLVDRTLIHHELDFQSKLDLKHLPRGLIHGDLFRDNVLFQNHEVSGLLDFYTACNDVLLMDIAITANDWCRDAQGVCPYKLKALLDGYETLRPLTSAEKHHWPHFLRASALRFWLSRLHHQIFPRQGEITLQKDPNEFRDILLSHRRHP